MSHFAMLVTGTDIDDAMAPYDENITKPKYLQYSKKQLIEKGKRRIKQNSKDENYQEYIKDREAYKEKNKEHTAHLNTLKELDEKQTWDDEKIYQDLIQWYEPDMITSKGGVYSTYNRKSKWDWYEIGGRWENCLILKNGTTASQAYKSEIDWAKTDEFFGILHKNKWHEQGEMGWFGVVNNPKNEEKWRKKYQEILNSIPEDTLISIVDCHI